MSLTVGGRDKKNGYKNKHDEWGKGGRGAQGGLLPG